MFYSQSGKKKTVYTLAHESIIKKTFRLKTNYKNNLFANLKSTMSLVIRLLKKNNERAIIVENDIKTWIYDVGIESIKLRKSHVAHFSSRPIGGVVFKSRLLYAISFFDYLTFLIFFGSLIVVISPLFFTRLRHFNWSLFLIEFVENVNLAYLLKKYKIHELVFYCIYERDANYTYLLLNKIGINVSKVTSEVPLALWNKIILTDTLILCSDYQKDEIKEFSKTIIYKEIEMWGPETAPLYAHLYGNKTSTVSNTIGFYSTANWLRELENDMLDFEGSVEAENLLKSYLKEFVSINPNVSLVVFLHPREKKREELTKSHYDSVFKGVTYTLNFDKPSAAVFDQCEVGVSFFSTIIFERDFFGFKTIVFPIGYKEFPIKETYWYNNSVYNKKQLFEKLHILI